MSISNYVFHIVVFNLSLTHQRDLPSDIINMFHTFAVYHQLYTLLNMYQSEQGMNAWICYLLTFDEILHVPILIPKEEKIIGEN